MVSVVNGSSSSGISVSWKEPSCSDVNDVQVTEYKIRYGIRSETQQRTVIPAINSGTMQYTISGNDLELFTEYSIEVAAVNSRGEGQYSQPKTAVITGGEFKYKINDDISLLFNHSPGTCQFIDYCSRHSLRSVELGSPTTRDRPHHTV